MNENKCHLIIIMFTLFTITACTWITANEGSTINTSAEITTEMTTGSSNETTIEDDDEDINANTPAN